MPKSNQLRVRLEDGQRERLLEIACARGKGERLSDIVRHAISEFITPKDPGANGSHIVNVTSQCKQRVTELADELNRANRKSWRLAWKASRICSKKADAAHYL